MVLKGSDECDLPCNDDVKYDRLDHTVDRSENICGNVPGWIYYLCGGSTSGISEDQKGSDG